MKTIFSSLPRIHIPVSVHHVAARRIVQNGLGWQFWSDVFAPRVARQPLVPCGPPGALALWRLRRPLLVLDPGSVSGAGVDLVAAVGMARLRDDAGIVAAAGEHKGDLGVTQVMQLVDRRPG